MWRHSRVGFNFLEDEVNMLEIVFYLGSPMTLFYFTRVFQYFKMCCKVINDT
jgi:hypothetical protein